MHQPPSTGTDALLVQRLRIPGEVREQAFRELHARLYRRLVSRALDGGFDISSAEDHAQDVFVDFLRGLHRLPNDVVLEAWLFRIAHCKLAQRFERQRIARERERHPDAADAGLTWDEMVDEHGSLMEEFAGRCADFDRDCVVVGLNRFAAEHPERFRAIQMKVAKLGGPAIAAALGRSEGGIYEYLSKCYEKARDYLRHCRAGETA